MAERPHGQAGVAEGINDNAPVSGAHAEALGGGAGAAVNGGKSENGNGGVTAAGEGGFVFVDASEGTAAAQQSASEEKRGWRGWSLFSGSSKEDGKSSSLKRSLSSKVPFLKSKEKEAEKKEPKRPLEPEIGAQVRVFGLVNAAQYNNSQGTIREILDGGSRFVVILHSHDAKQISVKLANIEVTKAAEKARGDDGAAGAMLKIAASKILKPKSGSTNYYEDLGISPTATPKEIKDAYYRMAKEWHPDKNKHDPEAEVRFKRISEAYQVLSDPEKRKIYDEQGAEGLEGFNLDHFKAFAATLFGGGEFEEVFGDVCELPVFKELLSTLVDSQGGAVEVDTAQRQAKLKQLSEEEEQYVKVLAERLGRRLAARVEGSEDKAAFEARCRSWAAQLCEAPGGMDLVEAAGNTWRRKARKIAGGLGSVLQEMKDLKNKVAEGSSLLYGAIKASAMAGALSKQVEASKTKEGKGALAGGEAAAAIAESASQPPHSSGAACGESSGTGRGGEKEEEEEEEEELGDVDPEEVRKFARHSIDLVWRIGLFLLQKRMRKMVDALLAAHKAAIQAQVEAGEADAKRAGAEVKRRQKARAAALAAALLELGECFRQQWTAHNKENQAAERSGGGAPLHLADDLASQVAQAREHKEAKAAAREA